jgi:hypothetical protein
MMKKKSILVIIISLILLFTSILSFGVLGEQTKTDIITCDEITDDWTLMYYLCGNLNFFWKEPLDTLDNISKIGSTEGLNIIFMKDSVEYGDSELILINSTGGKEILNEIYGWPDEVDTGNPNTLESFCKLMMRDYPAKHYALILVAPGGHGWQLRSLNDGGGSRGPTMPVFANTLKNITENGKNKIDVIFMESCVQGMLENAYEIAPYADYMVSSEEHIPDGMLCSIRYHKPVWDLINNTKMTPEDFASRGPYRHKPVNFSFYEGPYASDYAHISPLTKLLNKLPYPELHTVQMHTTCIATNLSRLGALVDELNNLSSFLILHNDNEDLQKTIEKARSQVREYGKGVSKIWSITTNLYRRFPLEKLAVDYWIDLYNLVDLIKENTDNIAIKNKCIFVMEKLNDSICSITKVPGDDSYGLSIYFPSEKYSYNKFALGPNLPSPYENLRFSKNTMWDEFLKDYLKTK